MNRITKLFQITTTFLGIFLAILTSAHGEFYEYRDKNGVKCYTDDPAIIPDQKRVKARIHAEKYDGMSVEEKEEMLKEEEKRLKEIKENQKEHSSKHEMWLRKTEYEERERRRMVERAESENRYKKWLEKSKQCKTRP